MRKRKKIISNKNQDQSGYIPEHIRNTINSILEENENLKSDIKALRLHYDKLHQKIVELSQLNRLQLVDFHATLCNEPPYNLSEHNQSIARDSFIDGFYQAKESMNHTSTNIKELAIKNSEKYK